MGEDVFKLVTAFLKGRTLTKSITYTNLILLPIKDVIQSYFDMRSINLI